MNDPAARLAVVRRAVPVELAGAVLTESWSNDTWIAGESVLRVCWRGDRGRLAREQALLEHLPTSVPHATALAAGRTDGLTWMLLRRHPGQRLDLAWPRLSGEQRRAAGVSLARVLGALHSWKPPPEVRGQMRQASSAVPTTRDAIAGSAIVPLPMKRLAPLLDWMEVLPEVGRNLAGRVRKRIDDLQPKIFDTEFREGVVVHGDAHLANVLWHEGRVTLLDFEWARLGPPDLELEAACRDNPDIERRAGPGPVAASGVPVLAWLRAGYPALFERTDLTERLWLYELCHQVRQLCASDVISVGDRRIKRLENLVNRPRVQFP